MSTLYENIKALCEENGITGAKMCLDIGASKSLMTGLKKGRTKSINMDTAQKIADYFGVSVGRVLGEETKKEPDAGSVELNPDYFKLSAENKALVDALIAQLSRTQSES